MQMISSFVNSSYVDAIYSVLDKTIENQSYYYPEIGNSVLSVMRLQKLKCSFTCSLPLTTMKLNKPKNKITTQYDLAFVTLWKEDKLTSSVIIEISKLQSCFWYIFHRTLKKCKLSIFNRVCHFCSSLNSKKITVFRRKAIWDGNSFGLAKLSLL